MSSYVKTFILVMILSCLGTSLFAQFPGGDGSPGDPYQIATPDHLNQVRFEPFASYIQIADIDFSTSMWCELNMISWKPIGMDFDKFIGTYDGDNYKILNLYINEPSYSYMGLFGYLEGATLQNIILSDVNVTSGSYTGALAGYSSMSSSIANCSSAGSVNGSNETGGLVGFNTTSTITGCFSTCNVNGTMAIGGLIGVNDNSTVTDCFARGMVTGEDVVGGFIGYSGMSNTINCYSTGATSAIMPTFGGLIGYEDGSMILDSYWDMETSGCPTSFGGEGRLTVEMKMEPTFMNWDFITPIWNIDSLNTGYPYLAWSIPQEPAMIFAGGNGSPGDPYQVETAEQLDNVRDYMNSYFIQIADIDLGVSPWNENEGWDPIGDDMEPFTGFYDGGYQKISGLYIGFMDDDIWNTGLFGYIDGQITGSTIENVILDGVSINEEKNVGALAGQISYANVSNCSSAGSVIGEDIVGGLIGLVNNYSNTYGCHSTCSVTGIIGGFYGDTVGGLIGELSTESSLSDSYATGSVTGENGVGGLIGYCGNNATITNCYSTGFITVNQDYAGGLVGFGDMVNEFFSYYDMDTSGQDTSFVGTGKTYSEMHLQSTYETWDFATVWQIDPLLNYGYPYLAWSTPPVNNTAFAGGDGSEANPYLVATPTQLDSVRNHLSANFMQVVNIDLEEYLSLGFPGYNSGEFWQPIGYEWERFEGIYDGNNKIIINFNINRLPENCIGLFSATETTATIKDLSIVNQDSITINGGLTFGSFVGQNYGNIENCYSNCNVNGLECIGGIAGRNEGTISNTYSTGNISSEIIVGGLTAVNGGTITGCYSTSNVLAIDQFNFSDDDAGGLVGDNWGEINNSYARGSVTGKEYIGGLVGDNSGFIQFCYSSGKVTGETNAGGLIASGSNCMESYWDTETSGQLTSADGFPKTNAEMKEISTFDNFWDFTTPLWMIDPEKNSGYPYLEWSDPVEPIISFEGGDGTQGDPYQVTNVNELQNINLYLDSYFIIMNNIDASSTSTWNEGKGFNPIGVDQEEINQFKGSIDGQGFAIANLYINRPNTDFVGPFGVLHHSSNISDLAFENVDITGKYFTGGFTGRNYGTIKKSSSSGTANGMGNTGGFVGRNDGVINNCYSFADANGTTSVGGFTGYSFGGQIVNSYSTGTASGTSNIGGFNGTYLNTTVINCFWDTESSGNAVSAAGIGKTTTEMQTISTYIDWDFTTPIWYIYSTNNNGYPYLDWKDFSVVLPEISTQPVSDIFSRKATGNAAIVDLGMPKITSMGVCWSLGAEPMISDSLNSVVAIDTTGVFTVLLTELSPQETYYVKSFAISPADTVYGNLVTFTTLSSPFSGGEGTEDDPYQVSNPTELDSVRYYLDSYFIQTADINLDVTPYNTGDGWVPIAVQSTPFTGNFNGQGKIIQDLIINNAEYPSLFGFTDGAYFSDLSVDSVNISGGYQSGTLISDCKNTIIERCSSSGIVTALSTTAGGLVGVIFGSQIYECFSSCTVISPDYTGGFAGAVINGSEINDCYASGDVTGGDYTGGFVSYIDGSTLTNSYSRGTVSGTSNTGGLIGYSSNLTLTDSYWDIDTSGQAISAGGIGKITSEMKADSTYIGWNFAEIWSRYNETNDSYPYFHWQGLATPFGAPQNVVTELSGNQLTISWDQVQNAVNYIIFVSDDPYGIYSFLDFTDNTQYSMDISGTRKFFYITASDMKKESLSTRYLSYLLNKKSESQ